MPALDLWDFFIGKFIDEVSAISATDLATSWKSSSARTALYEDRVLGAVASKMGLVFKKEEFKVDYTFCRVGEAGVEVPMVFVESENVATSAHHEIRKLCCLHAPLKVLIVCAEWSDQPSEWSHGGLKDKLLPGWQSQIRSHNKEWPSPSVTGIVVAEWGETLKYYALAFDHFGELADDRGVVFDRPLN